MKIGIILLMSAISACALSRNKGYLPQKTPPPQRKTLENKLADLKTCGMELAAPFTVKDLLTSFDRSEYEKEGYDLVLFGLAMTEEEEPWRNHSINVWNFDFESIYENGDYKRIAERLVEMTQGSLALQNIEDHVDCAKGVVWLSFEYKNKPIKLNLAVHDDWADAKIFDRFVELLKDADPGKLYINLYDGGQDCIIACVTKTNFDCLKRKGLNFVLLSSANFK